MIIEWFHIVSKRLFNKHKNRAFGSSVCVFIILQICSIHLSKTFPGSTGPRGLKHSVRVREIDLEKLLLIYS